MDLLGCVECDDRDTPETVSASNQSRLEKMSIDDIPPCFSTPKKPADSSLGVLDRFSPAFLLLLRSSDECRVRKLEPGRLRND